MAGERTEAPTPKRIKDARQQGNVSKSHELASIGVFLVAVLGARMIAPAIWSDLRDMLFQGLAYQQHGELTQAAAMQMAQDTGVRTLTLMAPMFALLALAGIAMNVAQTGFLLSGASLKPKLSRVNPGAGLKRIFSPEGLVNLFKSIAKMAVVALAVWMTLSGQLAEISAMGELSPGEATRKLALFSFDIALRSALVLFILAVADFAWQRRRYLQQLRMSKQELKQEMRESEGDPLVKQAQRRQRQSLLNRMIAAVPNATVVVTNPTHYAVALRYDPVTMQAPIVVAKGERLLAQRIKEVAKNAGVPVLEEPPLARALFAAVPVGHPIPANLFHAVAEVLAWVYSLRSRTTWSRPAAAGARGGL